MEEAKQLSLRWDKHAANLASEAECFFQDEAFLDCTLFAEGQCLQAHKLILSAASPYLATLLRTTPDKHPIVIFNDIKFEELKGIISFIYNGAINMPESSVAAFLRAAQALLIRGLTHTSSQWKTESQEARQMSPPSKRSIKIPAAQRHPPTEEQSMTRPPPPPYVPVAGEENSFRLQEVSMSNYPPTVRRYNKPATQHPNFVMSSWKLGSSSMEEKNGGRKLSLDEPNDVPPAHMFKKFRLEKPPVPTTEDPADKNASLPSVIEVKREVEDEIETAPVEPKIEADDEEQDCMSGDSREPFYGPNDGESPVPLLVCRTSMQDDSDGSWPGNNTSPTPDSTPDMAGQDLPCGRCNKRYKSRYALNRHVLYECGKARKSFACDECGKKVTRQDTLQKHKLIHLVQHMKEREDGES